MPEKYFEKTMIELHKLEDVKELARSISPTMHNIVYLRKGQKFYGSLAPMDVVLYASDESISVGKNNETPV